MNNTQKQTKLKVATVKTSAIEYQGLLNPEDNCHYIGIPQIVTLINDDSFTQNYASQTLKRTLGEDFRPHKFRTKPKSCQHYLAGTVWKSNSIF